MVYQNLIILIPYIYTVLLEWCMWYMGPNKVAIIIPPILQSFHFREMPSSFFPTTYSCSSVSSASGSVFQHQLVKQFQISTPTLAYSYSYTTRALPPFFYLSPCPSSDPISQWNHQKLIPISALDGGPQQSTARLNSAVNSQPFPQRPSHSSVLPPPFTQTPSLPILGGFWMRAFIWSRCSYAQFTGHV